MKTFEQWVDDRLNSGRFSYNQYSIDLFKDNKKMTHYKEITMKEYYKEMKIEPDLDLFKLFKIESNQLSQEWYINNYYIPGYWEHISDVRGFYKCDYEDYLEFLRDRLDKKLTEILNESN